MKALIQNTRVIDVKETEYEAHESLSWVGCDSSVEIGDSYDGSVFTSAIIPRTAEQKLEDLRRVRNNLLSQTDWTQGNDIPSSIKSDWTTYRQALRDITDSATSLDDVTWPTKPS